MVSRNKYGSGMLPVLLLSVFSTNGLSLAANDNALLPSEIDRSDEIIVSAAASLSAPFKEVATKFELIHGSVKIRFNFGGSGALKNQIQLGAPVDVFASASEAEPDALIKAGILNAKTRTEFASNSLVLICPKGKSLSNWSDLAGPLVNRIAISNPESVPSGRYAKETLQHKRLWQQVKSKLIQGRDVKQTVTYVLNGDVDAGIVFKTDFIENRERLRIVTTAQSGKDHSPIRYVAVSAKGSANGEPFVKFLSSPASQAVFRKFGFTSAITLMPRSSYISEAVHQLSTNRP